MFIESQQINSSPAGANGDFAPAGAREFQNARRTINISCLTALLSFFCYRLNRRVRGAWRRAVHWRDSRKVGYRHEWLIRYSRAVTSDTAFQLAGPERWPLPVRSREREVRRIRSALQCWAQCARQPLPVRRWCRAGRSRRSFVAPPVHLPV